MKNKHSNLLLQRFNTRHELIASIFRCSVAGQGLLDDLDATLVVEVYMSIGQVPFIHYIL